MKHKHTAVNVNHSNAQDTMIGILLLLFIAMVFLVVKDSEHNGYVDLSSAKSEKVVSLYR